jgi:hypothetical protein
MHMAHIVREMRGVAPTANGFFFTRNSKLGFSASISQGSRAISYTTSEVAVPDPRAPTSAAWEYPLSPWWLAGKEEKNRGPQPKDGFSSMFFASP